MDPTSSLSKNFADLSVHDQSKNPLDELSRVSDEHDRFTDKDHELLDAPIQELFGIYRTSNVNPGWPGLLVFITAGDKRLLPLTPQEAAELLTREPSIGVVLQNAWKEASFKEVRLLSEFSFASQSLA